MQIQMVDETGRSGRLEAPTDRSSSELLYRLHRQGLDLRTRCRWARRSVQGSDLIALHELFDEIDGALRVYVEWLDERLTQLGGTNGSPLAVVRRPSRMFRPTGPSDAARHVEGVARELAGFRRQVCRGIAAMDALADVQSRDVLTEIARGIDQWLFTDVPGRPQRVGRGRSRENPDGPHVARSSGRHG